MTPDWQDGYERIGPNPPKLMLPVGGSRALAIGTPGQGPLVVANADANGMIDGEPHCRAVLLGKLLYLEGRSAASVWIELRQGDRTFDIHVSVKDLVEYPVIAHLVEHGPRLKTRMTEALLRDMIDVANGILTPQANVKIVLDKHRDLTYETIKKRLGRTVTEIRGKTGDEWDVVTAHAERTGKPRLLNLFLVRRFAARGEGYEGGEVAATGDGCCIFEDRFEGERFKAAAAGSTLAHEVGHHAGLPHAASQRSLMYESQPRDDRLSRSEADRLNPTGVLISPF